MAARCSPCSHLESSPPGDAALSDGENGLEGSKPGQAPVEGTQRWKEGECEPLEVPQTQLHCPPMRFYTSTEALGAPWDHTQALTKACYGEMKDKWRKERTEDLRLTEVMSESK